VAILLGGRVVAQGSPAELARPRGVEIHTGGGVRTYARATREQVPELVAQLVEAGESVYEVKLLASTLEDAYLEAVGAS
jgi:phage tail tape-measure protein